MAMLFMKVTERKEGAFSRSESFGNLLFESISGFVEGRLPGDLGDPPEALNSGKGVEEQQLLLT